MATSNNSSMSDTVMAVQATDGQIVSIITWIALITSALAVSARLFTKWSVSKKFQGDDGFAVAAMLSHIGSGIAISIQDKNGLGANINSLTLDQKRIFGQSGFAANLLYITTGCFAKLSIIFLLTMITRDKRHRILGYTLGGFIALSSLAFFIAAAFSCQVPQTWNVFSHCYNRAAFWDVFSVINIFNDMMLTVLPAYIVIPLKLQTSKKTAILSCFATRLLDMIVLAIQLSYNHSFQSLNFTKDLWRWAILSQASQCIDILASCIPYLKPLLESFPSGMFMSDELRRRGTSVADSQAGSGTSERASSFGAAGSARSKHYWIEKTPKKSSTSAHPEQDELTVAVIGTGGSQIDVRHNGRHIITPKTGILKTMTFATE